MKQRYIFQITQPPTKPNLPVDFHIFHQNGIRFSKLLPDIPWLNRTQEEILGYYSFSDEDARYMGMFLAYIKFLKTVEGKVRDGFFLKMGNQTFIPSYQVFEQINQAFKAQIEVRSRLFRTM